VIPPTLLTLDTMEYHAPLCAKLEDLKGKIVCLTIGWLNPKHTRARLKANVWLSGRTSNLLGVCPVSELGKTTKAQTVF
jgi:hypothetical protein